MRRGSVFLVAVVMAVGLAWIRSEGAVVVRQESQPSSGTAAPHVGDRVKHPGYDRECGTGRGCVFGPAWSDDVDVKFGHNGCDTRNDVLRDRASEFAVKSGTGGCVIASGVVEDFYTGERMEFVRGPGNRVQIDHVVPLAAAWDLGANDWSQQQRVNFANDPANLVIATGSLNASKSDQTPGEWLPANQRAACSYVERYKAVASSYGIAVTVDDRNAIDQASERCSTPTTKGTE